MKSPTIDHIITFLKTESLDSHLEIYKKSGFQVNDEKVRHPYGKLNAFITFGLEYIEFFWVEDKKEFLEKSVKNKKYEIYFYNHNKVFAIGFMIEKLASFHKYIKNIYPKIPDTYTRGPSDKPEEKSWEFLMQPVKYLSGFYSFCLSYLKRDNSKPRKLRIAKNATYAISGVTFVAKKLSSNIQKYKAFFDIQKVNKINKGHYEFMHGPHKVEWLSEKEFKKFYGLNVEFLPKYQNMQCIQLIHLYCDSLKIFNSKINKSNFILRQIENKLFVQCKKDDGFKFIVEEKPIKEYVEVRSKFSNFVIVK